MVTSEERALVLGELLALDTAFLAEAPYDHSPLRWQQNSGSNIADSDAKDATI